MIAATPAYFQRPIWQQLLHNGLRAVAINCFIALMLWILQHERRLDVSMVYSQAIGLTIWLLIDGGRFLVDPKSPIHFPRGWRAVALIFFSVIIGFAVGTTIGDTYAGHSTWDLYNYRPRSLLFIFLGTVGIALVITYQHYLHGKSAFMLAELEASRRQASETQLRLLQSQLQPHMLFNTLANLRALIGTDDARAVHMLDRFNDYLRATLAASRATSHPLSAEFDRLRDYLELMAVRMGPRLTYTLDLPDDLRNAPISPLLLQSLIENAIVHGLEPTVAGGHVSVRAHSQAGVLTIDIQDNGAGFAIPPGAPTGTMPSLQNTPGFGIAQVRERLASSYGNLGTIKLIAAYAGNTWLSVQFPLQKLPPAT